MSRQHETSKVFRSAAEDRFAKAKDRDTRFAEEQARLRQALDDKSARLRDLRLAKETADKIAAEELAATKKAQAALKKRASRWAADAKGGAAPVAAKHAAEPV